MKTLLYIFGTSHPLQCGSADCTNSTISLFEAEVRKTCQVFAIQRIAEEMTEDGLKRYGVTETVGQRIAKDLGIAHHNVDLNLEERNRLSLGDYSMARFVLKHGFPDGGGAFRDAFTKIVCDIRERCWCARVIAREEWPTLLICGADHVNAVHGLWDFLEPEKGPG
jgi:hypothetical protein